MRPLMILAETYDALFITDLKFLIMGYVSVVVSWLEYPEACDRRNPNHRHSHVKSRHLTDKPDQ